MNNIINICSMNGTRTKSTVKKSLIVGCDTGRWDMQWFKSDDNSSYSSQVLCSCIVIIKVVAIKLRTFLRISLSTSPKSNSSPTYICSPSTRTSYQRTPSIVLVSLLGSMAATTMLSILLIQLSSRHMNHWQSLMRCCDRTYFTYSLWYQNRYLKTYGNGTSMTRHSVCLMCLLCYNSCRMNGRTICYSYSMKDGRYLFYRSSSYCRVH
mmetsp:Transcript_22947/g.54453  ORF Transcript_22947/g.54453 Transcript_22947/m.54453 type:complete len:209 (-) Transcript_22947:1529-2155(-)